MTFSTARDNVFHIFLLIICNDQDVTESDGDA